MNKSKGNQGDTSGRFSLASGFTLIELIVVVAIIAVLVAIIFPAIVNARQAAYKTTAMSQIRQLGIAAMMYAGDFDSFQVPSTNYGLAADDEARMWSTNLFGYAAKSKGPFIAKGSNGMYPGSWELRGWGSFGMNAATAVDPYFGCVENQIDKTNCSAFQSGANIDQKNDNPSMIPLFTTTPAGPTEKGYRGYEFNPYNGLVRPDAVRESPPLAGDRDLVAAFPLLAGDLGKPVFARYGATGKDEGFAPVLFADGHANVYQAKAIKFGKTGILWRFR